MDLNWEELIRRMGIKDKNPEVECHGFESEKVLKYLEEVDLKYKTDIFIPIMIKGKFEGMDKGIENSVSAMAMYSMPIINPKVSFSFKLIDDNISVEDALCLESFKKVFLDCIFKPVEGNLW